MDDKIKINYDNIIVEDIMRQIRENIKNRNYSKEDLEKVEKNIDSFCDNNGFDIHELHQLVSINNIKCNILKSSTIQSNRRIISPVIVFLKRVIRKLSYWYIQFLVDQQNEFNASITKSINQIEKYIQEAENEKNKDNKDNKDKFDFDYFKFESQFRGSREEIKERQRIYLEYFIGRKNVVDIGCGRGEFLELLSENGVEAKGIDINIDNVKFCLDNNLSVKQKEAIQYLKTCQDSSLGGIFMAQVVEHMKYSEIIELIKLAEKKLQLGAPFVIETVNPQCLMVYVESFYMDPSHNKPIHPLTLKFLLETSGFPNVGFKYSSPVADEIKIPSLEGKEENSNIDAFNKAIMKFNELMYGYRDYAVIASK